VGNPRLPRKDIRKLVKQLERQGFRTQYRGSGHVFVYSPDGVNMAAIGTTGKVTSYRNALSRVRAMVAKV
jgi:predicted RNA binding protein YcfA (HicA-like mRNA interferase family)